MESMDFDTLNQVLTGESLLYGLLGRALYAEPDKDWLDSLAREEVFAESPFGEEQPEARSGLKLLQDWSSRNAAGVSEAEMQALKSDQLYLFIGTDRVLAPVWESIYFNENRLVFQEQTLQVREWYAKFGLQIERLNREPDDHIGLELSFVSQLASLALGALEAGNPPAVEAFLQAQAGFLSEHLLRWGPAWARLVDQHAKTDFYRGLAHLAHGALLASAALLEISLPKEVSL